jgi:hypothetical protein
MRKDVRTYQLNVVRVQTFSPSSIAQENKCYLANTDDYDADVRIV